jgi:hypothetical protein
MIIVDAWLVYSQITCTPQGGSVETQQSFYGGLATELIDNKYGTRPHGSSTSPSSVAAAVAAALDDTEEERPTSGISVHLTPSKRKRKVNGEKSTNTMQGRCKVCKTNKTTFICSACSKEPASTFWLCHNRNGNRACFREHCREHHADLCQQE